MEQAYAQTYGGWENIVNGGNPDIAWKLLTGELRQPLQTVHTMSDSMMLFHIERGLDNDHAVFVTSHDNITDTSGVTLVENHAYIAVRVNDDPNTGAPVSVTLYNPHGKEVNLPIDRLNENIAQISYGEVPQ